VSNKQQSHHAAVIL